MKQAPLARSPQRLLTVPHGLPAAPHHVPFGQSSSVTIGVIADTHGLLRPQALAALEGVSAIVHAGDIGSAEILSALARIAPVVAVRGNNDVDAWASNLPETATLDVGKARLYVTHDLKTLAIDPRAEGVRVVIGGHSHKPTEERREGVLYLNPGSAGPRRFRLPITLSRLTVTEHGDVSVDLVDLASLPLHRGEGA